MHDEDDVTIESDSTVERGMSEDDLEASESREGAKVAKVKKELETVKREKQEYLDGWQRAKADYVNALKRFEDDKKAAQTNGMVKAIKALIPAYDALERAKASGDLPEGFAGIAKQLEGAFAGFGMTPIGAIGEEFDPNKHEALGTDPTTDLTADDTITAVLEPGYAIGDSVIRPARVRVAQFGE
ncbi:MAG: grpE [Parcubacteria group bacterium]|nr:grpE [Parcubacteria group bacterium]